MAPPLPSKQPDKQRVATVNPDHAQGPADVTFFDLPQEIRDHIYDLVVELEPISSTCPCLPAWNPKASINKKRSKLDQVNRQLRAEFLPRWHRRIGLSLYTFQGRYRPDALDNLTQRNWLKIFGRTRVPMIREFRFRSWPSLTILLRGGQQDLAGSDVKLCKYRTDSSWADVADDIVRFAGSLLRRKAGVVYLTKDDVSKLGNYLQQILEEREKSEGSEPKWSLGLEGL